MFKFLQFWLTVMVLVLLSAPPARAQFLQNLHLNGSGDLSAGYSASFGDQSSGHELDLGGDAAINGYYYTPAFASFNILPYYNQSRANSNFQSIGDSSGVSSSASFFTGSHFPGSIGFSKTYNSTGTYGEVGTPNFTTHGDGTGYSIGWSALLPNLPPLTVSYTASSGSSDIYGSSAHSSSTGHTWNVRSSYVLAGFKLNAFFTEGGTHGDVPSFLSGEANQISDSSGHTEGINVSHRLPVQGFFAASYMRSSYSSSELGTTGSENTVDTISANASFRPMPRLTITTNTSYSDNLSGSLNEQIISSGGTPVNTNLGSTSRSFTVNGGIGYAISTNMGAQANVSRQVQYYAGTSYAATFMSGTIYYNRKLWDMFTFSVSGLDEATDAGNGGLGMQGNINFSKRFKGWDTDATVSYAQDVQTLLITYTTSYVNYNGHVRRRLTRRLSVNGGFGGSHSGFTQQAGTTNRSESVFGSVGYGTYNFTGNYTTSSGISVLTANGLSTGGLTPVISPLDQIVYNGTGYSVSASASPIRKLTLSATYANTRSSTIASSVSSLNLTTSFNSQLQYRVRRMGFMAGFTRFSQGISAGGAPAAAISSYYVGINRWINFF